MPYFSGEKMTGGYGGPDIINSCSINVNKGEIVTILGPNGAGKSTAMKAMLGMLNLHQGKVTFNDTDISNLSPQDRVRKGISFVPQTRNVFTGMSVEENLEMGAYIRDENFQDTLNEIYKLFPILKEKRKQFAGELSGGQRQQVALGRALMIKPSVLMLDEPTAGVDVELRKNLWENMKSLNNQGVTIILTTHYLEEAEEMCTRIGILNKGNLVALDSTKNLLNKIQTKKVTLKIDKKIEIKKKLDFGVADVVVAIPNDWIDVQTVADLEEVSFDFRDKKNTSLRVATKYPNLTNNFLVSKGITQYKLVPSLGATETYPFIGSAEIITDITSTGKTLKDNNLRVLKDGCILNSQACLLISKKKAATLRPFLNSLI